MIVYLNIYIFIILCLPILVYLFLSKFVNHNYYKALFIFIFSIYLINMLNYAIFPMYFGTDIAKAVQKIQTTSENIWVHTTLVPFFDKLDIKDFILNIVMTFPFGVLYPLIFSKKKFAQMLMVGFLLGLSIESTQLMLGFIQGFTFRNISINDVIANFSGVILGYFVIIYFSKCYVKIFKMSTNKILHSLCSYLCISFDL